MVLPLEGDQPLEVLNVVPQHFTVSPLVSLSLQLIWMSESSVP